MTATRQELKKAFGNGMLPSGEDFGDLIDSMLPQTVFNAHVQAFEAWKARPEITFGTDPDDWVLKTDDTNRLGLARGDVPLPEGAGDLRLGGVVQMGARTGAVLATDAFADPATAMRSDTMQAVKADGKWHDIIVPPDRAVSFEVTAYAPAPPHKAESGLRLFLRKLTGLYHPVDCALHAVASAAPGGYDTALCVTQSPDPRKGWTRLWRTLAWLAGLLLLSEALLRAPLGSTLRNAIIAAETDATTVIAEGEAALNGGLAKLLSTLGMQGWAITASSTTIVGWALSGLGIALLLWLLRLLVMAWRGSAHGTRLDWRKAKGGGLTGRASHALRIKAAGDGSQQVRYAITRLWD